jgi:hypothetical protein
MTNTDLPCTTIEHYSVGPLTKAELQTLVRLCSEEFDRCRADNDYDASGWIDMIRDDLLETLNNPPAEVITIGRPATAADGSEFSTLS